MFIEDVISDRLRIYKNEKVFFINSLAEDVKEGLNSENKFLLPKYFYDERGSELFERICKTREYYPTRAETEILKDLSETISERNSDKDVIVELGSGTSVKTDILIKAFLKTRNKLEYIPLDVSNIIVDSSLELTRKYSKLHIKGIISFYEEGMEFIVSQNKLPKIILFLGSSIGNLTSEDRIDFMKMLGKYMNSEDRLLVGFDLIKDKKVLEDAYNDSEGLTAEFNLNILRRINKELDADFNLDNFKHIAEFNEAENKIEMFLRSENDTEVNIKGIDSKINLSKGERIHTENSYKFNKEIINKLAEDSGMIFSDYYTDNKEYFSLCAFRLN